MRIILADDEGTVLDDWNVEEEFGDVTKAMPRMLMGTTIAESIVRAEAKKPALFKLKPAAGPFVCPECKSSGFDPSVTGKGCTFCDGSFGGHPPPKLGG